MVPALTDGNYVTLLTFAPVNGVLSCPDRMGLPERINLSQTASNIAFLQMTFCRQPPMKNAARPTAMSCLPASESAAIPAHCSWALSLDQSPPPLCFHHAREYAVSHE